MIIPKIPGFNIGTVNNAVMFTVRNTVMSSRSGKFTRKAITLTLSSEEAINIAARLILAAWKAQEHQR